MKEKKELKKQKQFKSYNGITIVALVLTIVLMLILASITIGALNGGLINYAGKAQTEAVNTDEAVGVEKAYLLAKGEKSSGTVTAEKLQEELVHIFGENATEVIENEDSFAVKKGNFYYVLNSKGVVKSVEQMPVVQNVGQITSKGSGTQENPYKIECIEDLVALSKIVNTSTSSNGGKFTGKYIVLTKDLNFNSIFSYANYQAKYSFDSSKNAYVVDSNSETTIKELCTSGKGFIAITHTGPSEEQSFQGIFDGQDHTISNIYINNTHHTSSKGLFGKIRNATIKNLTVDGLIKGKTTGGSGLGAVAGLSSGTSYIINCCNKGTVDGEDCYVGGIIGNGTGCIIRRCRNEGTVKVTSTALATAYGICANSGTVYKCVNNGTVCGKGPVAIGGLGVGTVINSYNISDMGDSNVGAVSGLGSWSAKNSFNIGNITSNPSKIAQYGGSARDKMWNR